VIVSTPTGYPPAWSAITDICRRHGLTLIEDCCLALGSRYRGQLVGTFGRRVLLLPVEQAVYLWIGRWPWFHDRDLAAESRFVEQDLVQPTIGKLPCSELSCCVYRAFDLSRTTASRRTLLGVDAKSLVSVPRARANFGLRWSRIFFKGMTVCRPAPGFDNWQARSQHRAPPANDPLYDSLLSEKGWPVRQLPSNGPVLVATRCGVAVRSSPG